MPSIRKSKQFEERRLRRWQELNKLAAKGRKAETEGVTKEEATDKVLPAKSDKVARNAPCPCESGKKYKKCCLLKEEAS